MADSDGLCYKAMWSSDLREGHVKFTQVPPEMCTPETWTYDKLRSFNEPPSHFPPVN